VIVASPDQTHVEFVLECLRCAKPALCEKPLAASAAEARRVVDAEIACGRQQVAVGFMRRFDPQHLAVQQAVASGDLGRAIAYKGVHRNVAFPYRITGEAVLTSSASHDIDAARWLLGQEVTQVFVRGVRSRASFSAEARDLLLLQLSLSGDCLAAVEVFVSAAYGYEVAAEIVGEQGVAVTTQPDLAAVRLHGAHSVAVSGDWLERFQPAYLAELAQWAQAIRGERAFAGASAWDGYMSLLAIDACIQSLQSGQPVDVPSIAKPALYGAAPR
jgi:myo-inositol 2-dehydrogenase/D-chiro-inositol 1-dehydrogenase